MSNISLPYFHDTNILGVWSQAITSRTFQGFRMIFLQGSKGSRVPVQRQIMVLVSRDKSKHDLQFLYILEVYGNRCDVEVKKESWASRI
jgi:hypothetical protein